MNTLTSALSFLQAAGADAQGGNLLTMGLTFGAVILIFYFLIIRPQNKKQKDLEKMLKSIKKGDKIVTIGGMRGVVERTTDETVFVKVDEGSSVTLEFNRSAVANILNPPAPKDEKVTEKKADKKAKAEETKAVEAPAEEKK